MPNPPRELRIRDAIVTELQKIGVQGGAGAWLTTPTIVLGVITQAPLKSSDPQIFIHWAETNPQTSGAGAREPSAHFKRATFHLWCLGTNPATGLDEGLNLMADVLRALYAAEHTLVAPGLAEAGGVTIGTQMLHPESLKSGTTVVGLELHADFRQDHSDP